MASFKQSLRVACTVTRQALPRATATSSAKRTFLSPLSHLAKSFSTSRFALSAGQADSALVGKLQSELKFEQEATAEQDEPDFIASFKQEGVWEIEDKVGFDEVALTRSFGNEEIRILFSIADLDSASSPEDDMDISNGSTVDEESPVSANESTSAEEEDDDADESFPVRTAITISKAGSGALTIDAVAQDGLFMIDSVSYYKDELVANDMTADGDWRRRALYMGPEFDALDPSLQQEFESFLEERGINSNLALFIPDLAEWKEQQEYVRWLEGVKQFIEA